MKKIILPLVLLILTILPFVSISSYGFNPVPPWQSFVAPPIFLRAHSVNCNQGLGGGSGSNCPTIGGSGASAGIMNTTTNNIKATSYTGTYNSNGVFGTDEYCNCVPTPLGVALFSINGTMTTLTINATQAPNEDFSLETTFYAYFPVGVTGTNCGTTYNNAHWFDIETFYVRYTGGGYNPHYPTAGWNYNGCGSTTPTTITYREVYNQTSVGTNFHWLNFNITALLLRGLAFQNLPANTQVFNTAIEIGTETYGTIVGATWTDYQLTPPPSLPNCGDCGIPIRNAFNLSLVQISTLFLVFMLIAIFSVEKTIGLGRTILWTGIIITVAIAVCLIAVGLING